MTRIETGTIAGLLGVLAATTVQVGEGTLAIIITAVLVPLAGALWREREKRITMEHKCERLSEKLAEFEAETPHLHDEVEALRIEVEGLIRGAAREGVHLPSPVIRSTPRPTSWRSHGRSRPSSRGSGVSSASTDACRT